MTDGNKIKVTFTNPRSADTFRAELGPATTGAQAIDGLVKAKFIEAPGGLRNYVLQDQKSSKSIPLSARLAESGVADGDTVAIVETNSPGRG